MKVKVQVTAKDILCGKRQNSRECPIAQAVFRAFGLEAEVGSRNIVVGGMRFKHDRQRQNFIWRFDGGESVEPFDFELEVPEPTT